MKKLFLIIFLISALIFVYILEKIQKDQENATLLNKSEIKERPLEKYTVENLSKAYMPKGKIILKEKVEEKYNFDSYIFEFYFHPNLDNKTTKKTSGLINIPKGETKYPLVIMIRGYVDPQKYQTGIGSKDLSYFIAENKFITIAVDFLGYAFSDKEAENIFESRFQTYTTILSLIKSADQIEKWNKKDIFIWGHSNGGQIALYVLEVLEEKIPTSLWAPVSKPFPYSILYYTDKSQDKGRFLRNELAKFEELYDVDNYSITNYFDRINAPILLIQGTKDDAVPERWSDELFNKLKSKNKEISYSKLEGGDHNLQPRWDEAAQKTLEFFNKKLTEK